MAKGKRPPEPIPPGEMHIRLEIDRERHAIIRVMAAQAGMSMAAFVRAAIIKLADEYQKRRGGK